MPGLSTSHPDSRKITKLDAIISSQNKAVTQSGLNRLIDHLSRHNSPLSVRVIWSQRVSALNPPVVVTAKQLAAHFVDWYKEPPYLQVPVRSGFNLQRNQTQQDENIHHKILVKRMRSFVQF